MVLLRCFLFILFTVTFTAYSNPCPAGKGGKSLSSIFRTMRPTTHTVQRSSLVDISAMSRFNFMHQLISKVMDGDLEYEIHKKPTNLVQAADIPIAIYVQIPLDLRRSESMTIIDDGIKIMSLNKSQGDYPSTLVSDLFHMLVGRISSQTDLPRSEVYRLAHLAMASRTQTFQVEALQAIYKELVPSLTMADIALTAGPMHHVFTIKNHTLLATSTFAVTLLDIGNVNSDPGIPGKIVVKKSLNFSLLEGSFADEIIVLSKSCD